MNDRLAAALAGLALAALGLATLALSACSDQASATGDPRQQPPLVRLVEVGPATAAGRGFTGVIGAKVEGNLGFRVGGKVIERMVDAGQVVRAGQPLMRMDPEDLRLGLVAKRNAVAAARALATQLSDDEKRFARLASTGAIPRQRYGQAKAASDTATAQLAAAEADARVAGNQAMYSVLRADADGTVMETLGEPGQVVAAGQTVVRLAHAGPREAVVALPEGIRPAVGAMAEAQVYGDSGRPTTARLRQLSDAADPRTRTYEARYVLDGDGAKAPLGATVTIRMAGDVARQNVEVPLGAVLDDGRRTGVWAFDRATSTVHFVPVKLVRVSDETALVSGVDSGRSIVALGAQLLREGAPVRTAPESRGAR